MGSAEVLIDVDDFDGAAKKFEDTYDCFGMDTKMHRFPGGLRCIGDPYIAPRVVAIGPYHHKHGLKHLQMMEEVKRAAVSYFAQRTELDVDNMRKAVHRSVVEEGARGRYIEDATTKGMTDDEFVGMMLRDACFLLLYMDAYSRSLAEEDDPLVNASLRRFLFSNRDSIENDIMLLENQLPWPMIQALIDLASQPESDPWSEVVTKYIVAMGNTFRVSELSDGEETYNLHIKANPPPHLLALLRRHKIESRLPPKATSSAPAPVSAEDETQPQQPLLFSCFPQKPLLLSCFPNKPKDISISVITPMELEEIGVKLQPSGTDAFSDMDFVKGRLFHLRLRELSLAPLSLSNARASCLVNMAAFEICTASRFLEDRNKTAICSYLALLAMFMVREDDVHKLRSQGLLHGPHSNMEMLTFFKTVRKHLPDSGARFAGIMIKIAEYKNNSYRAKAYKLIHNNRKPIVKGVSIILTLIAIYQAILSLNEKI